MTRRDSIGDLMRDRYHLESSAVPSHSYSPSAQRDADKPRPRNELWVEEQQKEWLPSMRNLQEWICELLIENQQLRMSLRNSTTSHQYMEADE
jgi:hypothetical protein